MNVPAELDADFAGLNLVGLQGPRTIEWRTHESGDRIVPWGFEREENTKTSAEEGSDAAKLRDCFSVGTLMVV